MRGCFTNCDCERRKEMDINGAQRMLGQMETWATEAGLRILEEKEEGDRSHSAVYLAFLSQVEKDGMMADVITCIIYEQEIVMLCIRFHADLTPAKMPDLMELVNLLNFYNVGNVWIVFEDDGLLECRTTLWQASLKIYRDRFVEALNDLVDSGYAQYHYFRRLIEEDEKFLSVKADIMRGMGLDTLINLGTETMGIC